MKNYFLLVLLFSHAIFAQKITLPSNHETYSELSASGNGNYLAIRSYNEVEILSGDKPVVIFKENLEQFNGQVLKIGLSYSGKYLAVLGHDEYGCLPYGNGEPDQLYMGFYEIDSKQGLSIIDYLSVSEGKTIEIFYSDNYRIESNENDDFYLKVVPDGEHSQRFGFLIKYSKAELGYNHHYTLGDYPEGTLAPDDFQDDRLGKLAKSKYGPNVLYYGLDEYNDEVAILCSYSASNLEIKANKDGLQHYWYTYGVANIGSYKNTINKPYYRALFYDALEPFHNEGDYANSSPYNLENGADIPFLKPDGNQNKLFGITTNQEFILTIYCQSIGSFNLTEKQRTLYDGLMDQLPPNFPFPFVGNLNTEKLAPLIPMEVLAEKGHVYLHHDFKNFWYDSASECLYFYGENGHKFGQEVIVKYNTSSQTFQELDLGIWKSKYHESNFRNDGKLEIKEIYEGESFSFKYQLVDLENLSILVEKEGGNQWALWKPESFQEYYGELVFYDAYQEFALNFNLNGLPTLRKISFNENLSMRDFASQFYYENYDWAGNEEVYWVREEEEEWPQQFLYQSTYVINTEMGDCYDYNQQQNFFTDHDVMYVYRKRTREIEQEDYYDIPFEERLSNTYYDPLQEIIGIRSHIKTQTLFAQHKHTINKFNGITSSTDFSYVFEEEIRQFEVNDFEPDSLMVVLTKDGIIHFYNHYTNKHIAKLYIFKDLENWLITLPNNYFYGTKNAVSQVAFSFNDQTLPAEYFDLKYNRPDKVLEAIGFKNEAFINAYKKAYLKRLKKLGIDEEMLKFDFDVPYLELNNRAEIPTKTKATTLTIEISAYDLKHNLNRINIWNNGVAIYGQKGINIRDNNAKFYSGSLTVPLANGVNEVQISVMNEAGSESFKETVKIELNENLNPPNLYIATIGVSNYKSSQYNLSYASKDAQDILHLFENAPHFNNVFTKSLLNEEVTIENLEQIHTFFNQAEINDQVILFVAGHGVLDVNFDYYFASYDMDFTNPKEKGIPYESLEGLLDGIKPLKKLFFMDTCHSGEVDKEDLQLADNSGNNDEENEIVFRNVGEAVENKENVFGLANTNELMKNLFNDFRKGTGATVISSAGGIEFAMESEEWHNGLFTFCLINGIRNGYADLNGDGRIMTKELQHYVQTSVTELSKGRQTPTSRIENTTIDYQIW